MECPDCGGAGKIKKPVDMRTVEDFPCETCGGTGVLPEPETGLGEKLDEIMAAVRENREAIRFIQVQNRSLFYRPDLHRRLVYEVKEPFKRALRKFTRPGILLKARALWGFYRVLRAVGRLPEPTAENVGRPNSRILCRIRNEFFLRAHGFPFLKELRRAVNLFIIVYDTDFYSPFINFWADELRRAEGWIPNSPNAPDRRYWKE
jgi:hypothetical protein